MDNHPELEEQREWSPLSCWCSHLHKPWTNTMRFQPVSPRGLGWDLWKIIKHMIVWMQYFGQCSDNIFREKNWGESTQSSRWKTQLGSVKRLNNRLVNKIQCQLMESGTHRNISSKYMQTARGFALPWRKHNLESWLSEIWPWCVICTQLLSPMAKRLCRSVKLFQDYNNMNTIVEHLCHEERVNGTGNLSEVSKRMIL